MKTILRFSIPSSSPAFLERPVSGRAATTRKTLAGFLIAFGIFLSAASGFPGAPPPGNSEIPARGAGEVRINDDTGRTILLPQPARRIIPLYGAFAEMLFSVGAGNSVIARTQADKFPSELVRLPSVGTHMRPDIELVLGLKPDLVIMSASRKDDLPGISRIIDRGIPVAVFHPKTFEDIFSVMKRIGILCGRTEEASASIAALSGRLNAVRSKVTGESGKKKVFFEIRAEPLTGAGRGSIVNEIISAAGGENILENDKAIVGFSLENLLLQEPDFYIVQAGPMNKSPSDPAKRAHFSRLKSVREGRVLFVDELIFSRPGPRCIDAVEQLAASLYPEKFK